MYKSKLQELCHKCNWALPRYTCMKDGPDHSPKFKASVMVNGTNFDINNICKSSKEAYNEAAKIAFLNFISETSDQSRVKNGEVKSEKKVQTPKFHSDFVANQREENLGELPNKFKNKLQIFAERKELSLPAYHVEREGCNAPCLIKATVNVGDECFVSQGQYKTSDEAEDAAAQIALLSLVTESFQEDPISYKNLFQELVQEEGFVLPMYTTITSGEPHNRMFISTVEVKGEIFQGEVAKSKKLAELNAAKVAYTAFIERKLFDPGYFSPRSLGDDVLKLASRVGLVAISEEKKDVDEKTEYPSESFGVAKSGVKMTAEMRSYMLGERVKVYTYIPDVALPTGTVVLPIGEDKWVKVSLEFPNENEM